MSANTPQDYRPDPIGDDRVTEAEARRAKANDLAFRDHRRARLAIPSNQEENHFYHDVRPTSFHKGLPHSDTGIVMKAAYEAFVEALSRPVGQNYEFNVPKGTTPLYTNTNTHSPKDLKWRPWESPLAGHYHSLEGPDPDSVAMAPAPRLGRSELCAELAEVYAMALVRDVPFADLAKGSTALPAAGGATVNDLIGELNKLSWFKTTTHEPVTSYPEGPGDKTLNKHENRRRSARWQEGEVELTPESLFRGSAPEVKNGPYLSQFLLIGTGGKSSGTQHKDKTSAPGDTSYEPTDGVITFGAQAIDQRLSPHKKGVDYMTNWAAWLDVQNGLDLKGFDLWEEKRRFITTPRDLATYVHFDQLYQAYFNACLILLENGVPADRGFPNKTGGPSNPHDTRGAFATFGGPHILSLMTEVASRALKAVRRQKFQVHRRGRPEQLAAMLTLADSDKANHLGNAEADFMSMLTELTGNDGKLLGWISAYNEAQNGLKRRHFDVRTSGLPASFPKIPKGRNYLLPMAFPEGSPMHAAYGAGHATVAGACVTMLKAFFEMDDAYGKPVKYRDALHGIELFVSRPAKSSPELSVLEPWTGDSEDVTLEGELNKLAANISIARNMAGVHFYTDYFDSLRMGERIAVGILQEQMLNYTEKVCMTFRSFDGDRLEISTSGGTSVDICINGDCSEHAVKDWWTKHVREFEDTSLDVPAPMLAAAE
ncbi:vanadium-dependent haloperoxidase [Rhodobacterales bacterium]|nr:vanadium-dependent haloperoxidase [Rhodobacterales bacterium]